MRRLFACLFVLILAAAPLSARAADRLPAVETVPAQVEAPSAANRWGMVPGEALTVGIGVVAGVIAMDVMVGSAPALIAGAVAGALIGSWWFDTYGPTLKPITGAGKGGAI